MNLSMIRPKNETEDLLLSITKNCEKLVKQTHRKPEETLELKMLKPREAFRFNPKIQIKGDWMIGLIDLEVYNSIFNITKENNKFELYTDTFDEFSFTELKDELEEILDIPNFTDEHLQHETIAPRFNEAYKKLRLEKSSADGYTILLMYYARSPFRDFESFPRMTGDLVDDDIHLILKQYNSIFVTHELDIGNYTIEDIQKAVYPLGDHEGTSQIKYADLNKKVKLIVTRFRLTFGTIRFGEKSFFHTLLGFDPYWDYKPTNEFNADSPGVYTSDKVILNLNIIDKTHLKCDCIDGSIQDGVRQPILFSFVLDKPSGYEVFSEPETVHYKRINKSVLKTITFFLEDNNIEEVDFNGETLTFTLQMIKKFEQTCFLCYR